MGEKGAARSLRSLAAWNRARFAHGAARRSQRGAPFGRTSHRSADAQQGGKEEQLLWRALSLAFMRATRPCEGRAPQRSEERSRLGRCVAQWLCAVVLFLVD